MFNKKCLYFGIFIKVVFILFYFFNTLPVFAIPGQINSFDQKYQNLEDTYNQSIEFKKIPLIQDKNLRDKKKYFFNIFNLNSSANTPNHTPSKITNNKVTLFIKKKFEPKTRKQKNKARAKVLKKEYAKKGKKISSWEAFKLAELENNQPQTVDDYNNMARDIKSIDKRIETPKKAKDKLDEKILNLPSPYFTIEKFNSPPGSREIDLTKIDIDKEVKSPALVSSDFKLLVFSRVYKFDNHNQVNSEIFYITLDTSLNKKDRILKSYITNTNIIAQSGMYNIEKFLQSTFTPIDFNYDNSIVAFKEKIAYKTDGLWQTNLWIYDFNKMRLKRLDEVREAIKYFWKEKNNLDLEDYRWDIFPLGFSFHNNNRIIVLAYAYTGEKPKFLGAWSIDTDGTQTKLLSLTKQNFDISSYGKYLKINYY